VRTRFGRLAMGGMLLVIGRRPCRLRRGLPEARARRRAAERSAQREARELKSRPPHALRVRSSPGPHAGDRGGRQTGPYPRHYVESRRATSPGARPSPRAHPRRRNAAQGRAPAAASWVEAGPFKPTVPARVTYTGRASLDSGRVTAMAIDPNCGQLRARAAAYGWAPPAAASGAPPTPSPRRPRGRRRPTAWNSNAIGSLTVDPQRRDRQHDLRGHRRAETAQVTPRQALASTGRPTAARAGSSSRAAARSSIDRSIGAVLVDPANKTTCSSAPTSRATAPRAPTADAARRPNAPTLGIYESIDGGAPLQPRVQPSAEPGARLERLSTGSRPASTSSPSTRRITPASMPRSSATGSGAARRTSTATAPGNPVFATRKP